MHITCVCVRVRECACGGACIDSCEGACVCACVRACVILLNFVSNYKNTHASFNRSKRHYASLFIICIQTDAKKTSRLTQEAEKTGLRINVHKNKSPEGE